jgi:tRNA pseudouridine55 synthase
MRSKEKNIINGWINLDKPQGLSSTQAIGKIRRVYNPKKIGHAGTLDPLATGILPIAMGEATKTIPYCQDALKTYSFSIIWGEFRDTDDAEGEVTGRSSYIPNHSEIENVIPNFIGSVDQLPPQYSAIKINGKRSYDLARKGLKPKLKKRQVLIKELELIDHSPTQSKFFCICGKGTYMRSLARDIALSLNTAGYIYNLRREAVGNLTLENSISLANLEKIKDSAELDKAVLPLETVLDDIPALALNENEAARLRNGQMIVFVSRYDLNRLEQIGMTGDKNRDLAIAKLNEKPLALIKTEGTKIIPIRVFNI